jgi:hypothetical protein
MIWTICCRYFHFYFFLAFFCPELQFYMKAVRGNVILPLNSRFCISEEFKLSGHCFMHFVELHSQNCPLTFHVYVISPMRNALHVIAYEAFNNYTGHSDLWFSLSGHTDTIHWCCNFYLFEIIQMMWVAAPTLSPFARILSEFCQHLEICYFLNFKR